jgi:hypothetical protein
MQPGFAPMTQNVTTNPGGANGEYWRGDVIQDPGVTFSVAVAPSADAVQVVPGLTAGSAVQATITAVPIQINSSGLSDNNSTVLMGQVVHSTLSGVGTFSSHQWSTILPNFRFFWVSPDSSYGIVTQAVTTNPDYQVVYKKAGKTKIVVSASLTLNGFSLGTVNAQRTFSVSRPENESLFVDDYSPLSQWTFSGYPDTGKLKSNGVGHPAGITIKHRTDTPSMFGPQPGIDPWGVHFVVQLCHLERTRLPNGIFGLNNVVFPPGVWKLDATYPYTVFISADPALPGGGAPMDDSHFRQLLDVIFFK